MSRDVLEGSSLLRGRVAVITGANSGIGFATAQHLARIGAQVILACRSPARAEAARTEILVNAPDARVELCTLDLASLASVGQASDKLCQRLPKIDVLINNAGVMRPPAGRTEEGFELQFGINYLGHFAFTRGLMDLLVKAPAGRVVSVSSASHWFGALDFASFSGSFRDRPWRNYAQSKLANLLFAVELDRRLRERRSPIISVAAHPGWAVTDLQRDAPLITAASRLLAMSREQGAAPLIAAATDLGIRGGEYFGPAGLLGLWGSPSRATLAPRARDRKLAQQLWSISETSIGARFEV